MINKNDKKQDVLIRVSNRHVHLSADDLTRLFGEKYELTVRNYLGASKVQFAAEETVDLVGPKGTLCNVRILGPCRNQTQAEILRSDCYKLGISAPVRLSGNLEGAAPLEIRAGENSISLPHVAIIAARHIHMDKEVAEKVGLSEEDEVSIDVGEERAVTFKHIAVRLNPDRTDDTLTVHIDVDESNAAGLNDGEHGFISSIQKKGE